MVKLANQQDCFINNCIEDNEKSYYEYCGDPIIKSSRYMCSTRFTRSLSYTYSPN